ncbi:hypothetical protein [uncultured Veillonella sp.]|uniref:hypothetical protein n=1 Tax=uncultured Veillonella sp. TaxID=159268 RepID=UPI0025E45C3D|nr:hypothetical protein [uncultured Veillonella sp.]
MVNYVENISRSGLSIYEPVDPENTQLYIPTHELETILVNSLIGLPLQGYKLRTRSKIVKVAVCRALGYPVPSSFKRTQPRFPGQNFDVYSQKSLNVQIWNEEVDAARRYVFLKVNENDIVTAVKVITGEMLAKYDRTGTLTKKYQASMKSNEDNICSQKDSSNVEDWVSDSDDSLLGINPNSYPQRTNFLRISKVYELLLPLLGENLDYLDAVQERNRGAGLHRLICNRLGYNDYEDDGTYPDIMNQLLEVKLQTSPTIDLGLHSPEDGEKIASSENINFYSGDIRYAIFDGLVEDDQVTLQNLYLVTGEDFSNHFQLFKGRGTNAKLQIPLPVDFFD